MLGKDRQPSSNSLGLPLRLSSCGLTSTICGVEGSGGGNEQARGTGCSLPMACAQLPCKANCALLAAQLTSSSSQPARPPPAHTTPNTLPAHVGRVESAHLLALALDARLVEHHEPHVDANLRRRQAHTVVPAVAAAPAAGGQPATMKVRVPAHGTTAPCHASLGSAAPQLPVPSAM